MNHIYSIGLTINIAEVSSTSDDSTSPLCNTHGRSRLLGAIWTLLFNPVDAVRGDRAGIFNVVVFASEDLAVRRRTESGPRPQRVHARFGLSHDRERYDLRWDHRDCASQSTVFDGLASSNGFGSQIPRLLVPARAPQPADRLAEDRCAVRPGKAGP
jgi:hypothetical protein